MREDGRKRFAKEIKERVEGLRGAVRSVKGELLGKGTSMFIHALKMLIWTFRWPYTRVCNDQGNTRYP